MYVMTTTVVMAVIMIMIMIVIISYPLFVNLGQTGFSALEPSTRQGRSL